MPELLLHHVSLVVTNLERSLAFYRDVIGLPQIPRPPIPVPGIWLGCGDRQIHLILYTPGTFRSDPKIDIADAHFAFRTDDFDGYVDKLKAHGFSPDAAERDPKRLFLNLNSAAGFKQLYVLDPDRNIVEINAAPMG
jgi:catechol 2,3-dioxygenase-like lactoylglutathione lyase family enzyme